MQCFKQILNSRTLEHPPNATGTFKIRIFFFFQFAFYEEIIQNLQVSCGQPQSNAVAQIQLHASSTTPALDWNQKLHSRYIQST